jgi:hypothetical protein
MYSNPTSTGGGGFTYMQIAAVVMILWGMGNRGPESVVDTCQRLGQLPTPSLETKNMKCLEI